MSRQLSTIDALLATDQYEAAVTWCEQEMQHSPDRLSAYWYLGLVRLLQGEEAEAHSVWFAAATAADPDVVEAGMGELLHLLLDEAQRRLHPQPQVAERLCLQALELNSEHPIAYLYLGEAVSLQGRLDEAVDYWQTTVSLQPDCREAYQNQGEVFQKLEQWPEAIAAYTNVLETSREPLLNWETYYNLGLCLGQCQRWQEAVSQVDQAIQQCPTFTPAYGDRGWALLQQGQWLEAMAAFHIAITHAPIDFATYCMELRALTSLFPAPAITDNVQFLDALRSDPLAATTYHAFGRLLARSHQWQLAIAAYELARQHSPGAIEVEIELAHLQSRSDPSAAIVTYQAALKRQPQRAEIHLGLGKLFSQTDLPQAIAHLQQALALQPDTVEAHVLLAQWFSRIRQWQDSIDHSRAALEQDPDRLEALCSLGYALAETGYFSEAITHLRRALSLQPQLFRQLQPLFQSLQQTQHPEEVENLFNRVTPPPPTFAETTQEWVSTQTSPCQYWSLDPSSWISLRPPNTIDRSLHFSFRFPPEIQLPGTFVVNLPQGKVWLNRAETSSAILTADDRLLGDLSPEFPLLSPGHPDKHCSQHSIFSLENLPPLQAISGTVAVLAGLTNDMYFHWIFDVLPRIHLLQQSEISLEAIDHVLVASRLPFQQESLQKLGIPTTKIISPNLPFYIQADRLIVPSYPGSPAWMPKWVCDWLRSIFLPNQFKNSVAGDRLYLSRKQTANRRVINESAVMDCLSQYGFQCVTLESLSVTEQAARLATAEVVIAPHGGGLTNTVFCAPGTKVIELFSPYYVYPCYWLLSNLLDLDYYYLTGKSPEGFYLHHLLYPDSRLEDIWIDVDELNALLQYAKVDRI